MDQAKCGTSPTLIASTTDFIGSVQEFDTEQRQASSCDVLRKIQSTDPTELKFVPPSGAAVIQRASV
jgi:hypothetical protein